MYTAVVMIAQSPRLRLFYTQYLPTTALIRSTPLVICSFYHIFSQSFIQITPNYQKSLTVGVANEKRNCAVAGSKPV